MDNFEDPKEISKVTDTPQWQKGILDQRLASYLASPKEGFTWEQLKAELSLLI